MTNKADGPRGYSVKSVPGEVAELDCFLTRDENIS